jgi:signal transduction histidine kinase
VSDNGRGITASELRGTNSLGLLSLRERALACGGSIEITGAPGRGTTVSLRVPLPGPGADQ